MRALKKYSLHLFLWLLMVSYFMYAPRFVARFFVKTGKPLQPESSMKVETSQVQFAAEGLEEFREQGERVQGVNGWAFMLPLEGVPLRGLVRELVLTSRERTYTFPVESKFYPIDPKHRYAAFIDTNTLGFTALISEDAIEPGKYRIGMSFRNPATGVSYYWDKPAHYLIKTPNTFTLK
jgi:hypothetical protein